jgi:hypothetical protein
MRFKEFYSVSLIFCLTSVCCVNFEDISSDASAVFRVCEEFFMKKSIQFDIIGFGRSNDRKILDMVGDVGIKVNKRSPSKIIFIDTQQVIRLAFSRPALIITLNDSLNLLHERVTLANFNGRPIKFLTYVYGQIGFMGVIDQYLSHYVGKFHHFEYLILHNGSEIALSTFEWFSPEYCNEAHLIKINTFDKESQKWQKPLVHEKFQNFHGCNLIMPVSQYSTNYYNDTFTHKKLGTIVDTFYAASQVANFTPRIIKIKTSDHYEMYKPSVHFLTMLEAKDISNYHMMPTFIQHTNFIVISASAPYTIYEKLFLPFDKTTWAFLITTFAIAFSVIFVVNFMPHSDLWRTS